MVRRHAGAVQPRPPPGRAGRPRHRLFRPRSSTGRSAARRRGASAASSPSSCWSVWPRRSDSAVQRLCRGSLVGAAVEALLIAVLVAQRSLLRSCRGRWRRPSTTGWMTALRDRRRAHHVGRDPAEPRRTPHRAGRDRIARRELFLDGVVAPVLWFAAARVAGSACLQVSDQHGQFHDRSPRRRGSGGLRLGGGAARRPG